MRVAMLSPVAWRTHPEHYGHWERVVSILTEGLVKRGVDVTLFATKNSKTKARLCAVSSFGYKEDRDVSTKVCECLHISELCERADEFDIIHNQLGFLPLSYSNLISTPVVTTIHGSISPKILPVFEKYNDSTFYVSTSSADRSPMLDYVSTVYNGVDTGALTFNPNHGEYLLLVAGVGCENWVKDAVKIAIKTQKKLVIAGVVQGDDYFLEYVEPHIDKEGVSYLGGVTADKLYELLCGAYALLYRTNGEEFALPVIESMACGTPVLAFGNGEMSELITNGRNGFLVSSVDEAVSTVAKIAQIDRRECLKTVDERFTVEKMVDGYMSVYEHIIEKRKREDHRPWGYYAVLSDEPNHKVKRIVVYPGKRLSLQRHKRRAEHWYVVYGSGVVTIDGNEIPVSSGDSVDIVRGAIHRVENRTNENMAFIEVQMGDYFGEDDIERLEDDYGRL